jgi:hypothetical protein
VNENHELDTDLLLYKGELYQQLRVKSFRDRMLYITLKCRWGDIIALKVHGPRGDRIYDMKEKFSEELEHIFDTFPKYYINILLGDFNAKVGRKDILNQQ